MANKNTNPGGGKTAVPGVMHSLDASRAHTRMRAISPTGILKESLTVLPGAHAREGVRTREGSAAALAGREITFTVHGRCGDADSGTQVKSITAVLDKSDAPVPEIEYAYSAGHEDDRTHIHYDEPNTLYIVGKNLSGAAVKVSYTDSDGDKSIDVPDDRVMAETDGISINGDWLAETLPHGLAADMTFTFTTAEGEASVTLTHE